MYVKVIKINNEDCVSEEKYLTRNGLSYTTYALLRKIKFEQEALKKLAKKKRKQEELMHALIKNRAEMSTAQALQQDILYDKYGLPGVIENILSTLLEERKNMTVSEALRQDILYETKGLPGIIGR